MKKLISVFVFCLLLSYNCCSNLHAETEFIEIAPDISIMISDDPLPGYLETEQKFENKVVVLEAKAETEDPLLSLYMGGSCGDAAKFVSFSFSIEGSGPTGNNIDIVDEGQSLFSYSIDGGPLFMEEWSYYSRLEHDTGTYNAMLIMPFELSPKNMETLMNLSDNFLEKIRNGKSLKVEFVHKNNVKASGKFDLLLINKAFNILAEKCEHVQQM